jgi:hypothetical protein
MSLLRFIPAAALLLLAACAAPGPAFEPVPAPARGYAVVYVYRPDRPPASEAPATFYINNVRFASLWSNGYTFLHLPARQLTLRQDWPMIRDDSKTIRLPLDLAPGVTYYLRLDHKRVLGPKERGMHMEEQWTLQQVEAPLALQELQSARLEPAVNFRRIENRALVVPITHAQASCTLPDC